jgi:hypothetical protein
MLQTGQLRRQPASTPGSPPAAGDCATEDPGCLLRPDLHRLADASLSLGVLLVHHLLLAISARADWAHWGHIRLAFLLKTLPQRAANPRKARWWCSPRAFPAS